MPASDPDPTGEAPAGTPPAGHADPVVPYQSLYRRFRPQRFGEVLGQEHVTVPLHNAVRHGTVSHAYLFSGPRGTGKTSTARILAKALNCTEPHDGEPCGRCPSCVEIARGTSLDVHELDAASNNGVDAMRDLVSRAALGTPGRTKVYIVDEVHMLSAAASNALLKTLEEPPAHVVFVLATTDPQKVLPTIRSRTQHFEFRLLGPDTLADLLRTVRDAADLGLDDEAVEVAVRRGRGSARDALSVLDQVAAGGAVHDEADVVDELAAALADGDARQALVAVGRAMAAGFDPHRLAAELADELRQGFLAMVAPEVVTVGDADRQRVLDLAQRMGLPAVVRAMERLGSAQVGMRDAPDPRAHLEVTLVRLTSPELDESVAALVERVDRLERALAVGGPAHPGRGPAAPAPAAAADAADRAAGASPAGGGPVTPGQGPFPADLVLDGPGGSEGSDPGVSAAPAAPTFPTGAPAVGVPGPAAAGAVAPPERGSAAAGAVRGAGGSAGAARSAGPPGGGAASASADAEPGAGDASGPQLARRTLGALRRQAGAAASAPAADSSQASAGQTPAGQTSAGPSPSPAGPASAGPASAGPASAGPASAGSASAGPSASPSPSTVDGPGIGEVPNGGGAQTGDLPTRDQLVQAWGDTVLASLPGRARARFRVGRFVSVADGAAVFALPNETHRSYCDDVRREVEEALAGHFGRRVPMRLVVDDDPVTADTPGRGESPATSGRAGRPVANEPGGAAGADAEAVPTAQGPGGPQSPDADDEALLDPEVLRAETAPAGAGPSAAERLKLAFPGAEEA